MFPISDSPNPKGLPWITLALMAANILVFLLLLPLTTQPADPSAPGFQDYVRVIWDQHGGRVEPEDVARSISAYDLVVFEHGYRPAAPRPVDALTSMFLHAGWMHLLGNMLFLWIYGNNAEARLGRLWFLLAYLGTGLLAVLGDAALRSASDVPAVGASGAISGVLGMYFVWFPHNKVRILLLLPPIFIRTFELKARLVLGFYIIANNLLPVLMAGGQQGGGTAYGAHIGGFVAGAALAIALNLREREQRRETHVDGRLGRARDLVDRPGRTTSAFQQVHHVYDDDLSPAQRREARELMDRIRMRMRHVPRKYADD